MKQSRDVEVGIDAAPETWGGVGVQARVEQEAQGPQVRFLSF